jgi:hypothetical protein
MLCKKGEGSLDLQPKKPTHNPSKNGKKYRKIEGQPVSSELRGEGLRRGCSEEK